MVVDRSWSLHGKISLSASISGFLLYFQQQGDLTSSRRGGTLFFHVAAGAMQDFDCR
jgi:hypothetical protein